MVTSDSSDAELRAAYEQGWSGTEIARATGLPAPTVYRWIRRAGGTIRSRGDGGGGLVRGLETRPVDIPIDLLRFLLGQGLTPGAVARRFKCRKSAVTSAMAMAGIPVPTLKTSISTSAPPAAADADRPEG